MHRLITVNIDWRKGETDRSRPSGSSSMMLTVIYILEDQKTSPRKESASNTSLYICTCRFTWRKIIFDSRLGAEAELALLVQMRDRCSLEWNKRAYVEVITLRNLDVAMRRTDDAIKLDEGTVVDLSISRASSPPITLPVDMPSDRSPPGCPEISKRREKMIGFVICSSFSLSACLICQGTMNQSWDWSIQTKLSCSRRGGETDRQREGEREREKGKRKKQKRGKETCGIEGRPVRTRREEKKRGDMCRRRWNNFVSKITYLPIDFILFCLSLGFINRFSYEYRQLFTKWSAHGHQQGFIQLNAVDYLHENVKSILSTRQLSCPLLLVHHFSPCCWKSTGESRITTSVLCCEQASRAVHHMDGKTRQ